MKWNKNTHKFDISPINIKMDPNYNYSKDLKLIL